MRKDISYLDYIFDYIRSFHTVEVLELYSLLSKTYIKNNDIEGGYKALMDGLLKAMSLNESFGFAVNNTESRLLKLVKERGLYDIITNWEKKVFVEERSKRTREKYYKIKQFRKEVMKNKRELRFHLLNQERALYQLKSRMSEKDYSDLKNSNLLKKVHDSVDIRNWKFFLKNSKAFTFELFPDHMIAWRLLIENLYESGNRDAAHEVIKYYRSYFFVKLAPTGYFSFDSYINSFVGSILKLDTWEYAIDTLEAYSKLFPWTSFGPTLNNSDIEKLYRMFLEGDNRSFALRFLNAFKNWPSEFDNMLDELSMHAFKDGKYSLSFYFCLKCSTPQSSMWSILSTFLITFDDKNDYSSFYSFIKSKESYFHSFPRR
ncbi:hypothetical protein BIY24_03795 [Halobacteriovorax marinus]|uniref:hypothetical protein n=1 Tax=Halobacteriovorax marinus TaxID=97084 RepID=UPI000BC30886|nr:hypothetical protein [Halobacteriovorax marinus]ATH07089.1 hypothetical protein BIY24_03795 [Halobacteriovorax marinus]